MVMHRIDFEPLGRRGDCLQGQSLLNSAIIVGLGLSSVCGGLGRCHTCKVQILSGQVSLPTQEEQAAFSPGELREGWRLACQTYPLSDCRVRVPLESMTGSQRIAVEGIEAEFEVDPVVRAYLLEMTPPTLSQSSGDAEILLAALDDQHHVQCKRIDPDVLRRLPRRLRASQWQLKVSVRHDEVVALLHRDGRQLGLAVDLGTTKIAGYLLDLDRGQSLAVGSLMNPQINYGEDVISRITFCGRSPEQASRLQASAAEAINELIAALCSQADSKVDDVVEATVAGNTAMHHILLRLPVDQLARAPYVPAATSPLDIKARDIGLSMSPGAYVHMLPNIAGFIGGDHVAMLLSTRASEIEGPVIAMDIGTNTELSLAKNGRTAAVSCASGPAFEGGHIRDGMRAAPGAIERVWIEKETVKYETVGGLPPIGICGSGILDALAQLYIEGIVDQRGRMNDSHPRIRQWSGQREFVLVTEEEREGKPAIAVTQRDIRELQLAKAAIRTGIQALLEASECDEEQLREIIIAGAFGTYIDVASAVTVGLLPSLSSASIRQVGNAAGTGAKMALLSNTERARAGTLAKGIRYLELASVPHFSRNFLLASYLGSYRIVNGRREPLQTAE